MPPQRGSWARSATAMLAPADPIDPVDPDATARRAPLDRWADVGAVVVAAGLGVLTLRITVDGYADRLTSAQVATDAVLGVLCCASLWWRRRWPVGVAVLCVVLGALSTSSTVAGLLALASLAVHRPARPAAVVAALLVPSAVVCSLWLGRTDTWSVLLPTLAVAAAAVAWGMYVRARRQLISTLRDRARRAEADQAVRAERARLAERARIAREMHDVLAHRISLVALHAGALEVAVDLPPAQVRESAALLRSTAHQALEELRDVIGVLREEPGAGEASTVPQPTLADIPRLVEETRRSGAKVDLQMEVDAAAVPGPLGRDAYRIVQEALTNVSKHARGTLAHVRVVGAPNRGLHVLVRNPPAVGAHDRRPPPGSGTGLLGLQERVALAEGTLVHGPDASGGFVVEAELPW
ncbi:MAG: histidine kinase [Acidimicrobiales bacterium]